jgi:hypothetical protein
MNPLLVFLLLAATTSTHDWSSVEHALGRVGAEQPDGAYKVSFPRTDLTVTLDGVTIKPALALGSWAAFSSSGSNALAMGDLVLLESEVNPVISALQRGGIDQTALHNHLIGESPRVMYMHFSGHGDAAKLAQTLHDALALTKTPMGAAPAAAVMEIDLPTSNLNQTIGRLGKAAGGVYQFAIPRAEKIMEHGIAVPASMGLATALNFQPTGNGRAAITGDFVMIASEVNPVIRALRAGGITVTALHSHMLDETPRLFFMHFWANDDALKLARTLHAALGRMNIKK